jgi:hypothetical protein
MLMQHTHEMMQTSAHMYIFLKHLTCHYAERNIACKISLLQQNEDMMLASARERWLEHSDCGMLSAIACASAGIAR